MRTAADALAILDGMVGLAEHPDGSNNAPPITDWWGLKGPWCNMTESYAWAQSGWSNDGGKTLDMPGVVQQKPGKGWARVDLMVQAFQAANRYGRTPRVGAAFHIGSGDGAHTGLVARVNTNGTVSTLEGNYRNRLARVTRTVASIRGYCYPDYAQPAPPPNQEDDSMLIATRTENGNPTVYLVTGGRKVWLDDTADVDNLKAAGVPVVAGESSWLDRVPTA